LKPAQPTVRSSRKYLYPPQGRLFEFLRGGWSQQCLNKSIKLNWNFQRSGGREEGQIKKPSVGEVGVFSGTKQY